MPKAGKVKLIIYDSLGRFVEELVNREENSGVHNVAFNSEGYSSGVYFYQLMVDDLLLTNKFMLLK